MDRWKREGLRSANSGLRNQIEHLLDSYEQQQPRLAEVFRQMEAVRAQASSPDQSVEVVVDANGVLTDLTLTAAAVRKSPDQLARTILDAVREAVGRAREQHTALTSPVGTELEDMPDLSDIADEAPNLREVRAFFRGEANQAD
ncbi:YbaB/EbfC family nucleoid-associated protein [Nocardia pseudovaccinii]|uniref:YbaB/EbfC family nucleoid-associated protein n=1 Tax=Nocardia pseudovaccinii TaxID=189540 RepID=UPI0007A562D7|nr:YbaB/EbfC family nucleoid-associated protein [Nocardia pseudovaccinii]